MVESITFKVGNQITTLNKEDVYFFTDVTTSIDDQKHYAEDAGKSKEEIAKILSEKKEIKYEAKGVLIL